MTKTEPVPGSLAKTSDMKKFSQCLSSPVITVTVGGSRTFYLHLDLLTQECKMLSALEPHDKALQYPYEDPDLFDFFVEYLYRGSSILSQPLKHASQFVSLAKLYALGDRFEAENFQTACLSRYMENFNNPDLPSEENICDLLVIAAQELPERTAEDPLTEHIFWYAATRLTDLQKVDLFCQVLCDYPVIGRHLIMWVGRECPQRAPEKPTALVLLTRSSTTRGGRLLRPP